MIRNDTTLHFLVPSALHSRLAELADEAGTTAAAVSRDALRSYLAALDNPPSDVFAQLLPLGPDIVAEAERRGVEPAELIRGAVEATLATLAEERQS